MNFKNGEYNTEKEYEGEVLRLSIHNKTDNMENLSSDKNLIVADRECPLCMLGISHVGTGGELCAYHEKLHGKKEVTGTVPLPEDYVHLENILVVDSKGTPPYPLVPKEEPVTTDPAWIAAKEYHNKYTGQGDGVIPYAFKEGTDWQKEQDRQLIQELRDALGFFYESAFIWKDFSPEFKKEVKSAITKADNYLK